MQNEQNPHEEPIIQLSPESTSEAIIKKEPNYILPAAILITGILIAGSVLYSKAPSAPVVSVSTKNAPSLDMMLGQKPADTQSTMNAMASISNADHIRGNVSAPIMLIEYSDLECPYCKEFHQTMIRLMNEYGVQGKLSWVYRNYPIASLHSKAQMEAEAAECAGVVGGNDKYWQYIDQVFVRTNSNNSLDPLELPKIAQSIGLDITAYSNCVSSRLTLSRVQRDLQDGQNIGIRGTPYGIFINTKTGQKSEIPGAVPYEVMKQMIDTTLSQLR